VFGAVDGDTALLPLGVRGVDGVEVVAAAGATSGLVWAGVVRVAVLLRRVHCRPCRRPRLSSVSPSCMNMAVIICVVVCIRRHHRRVVGAVAR